MIKERVRPTHVPFFSRCRLRDADDIARLILRDKESACVSAAAQAGAPRSAGARLRSAGLPTSRTSFMVSSPASTSSLGEGRSRVRALREKRNANANAAEHACAGGGALAHLRRLGGVADAALRRQGEGAGGETSVRGGALRCALRGRALGTLVAMTKGIDLRTCSWIKNRPTDGSLAT